MDRFKYTVISHEGMRYCNPLSSEKIETVLDLLDFVNTVQVLDLASGKGELLLRLVERYGAEALGVDLASPFIAEAQAQASTRIPHRKVTFLEQDVTTLQVEPESLDLVSCLGGCHILGGFQPTLQQVKSWVKPGGYILLGDGYWKQEPQPEYLAVFGGSRDECMTHAQNVTTGPAEGLVPLYACVCNDDEWDRYEWLHLRNIELYARKHSEDPDVPELLKRIRAWRDTYVRWGRDTLGFGLYLFQK